KVQGEGAAEEIAAALDRFGRDGGVDVIVVGRGGGSLEDLWAFNEEIVARAIHRCPIPVVSAVGHEVDVTVADFAADVRAPTPSAALEIILPDRAEIAKRVMQLARRLEMHRATSLRSQRERVQALARHWALRQPMTLVHMAGQRLDELRARFAAASARSVSERWTQLERLRELAGVLSPQRVLERGYAIARDPDGRVVREAAALNIGGLVTLSLARGEVDTEVKAVREENSSYGRKA
ncbi:MAG: exodeoxyribonuclease VII large subunit, partial [bacterium]|nr:exodeoxyribonuclease VII large subunit [bacterium]